MTSALVPKVTIAESTSLLSVPQQNQVVIGLVGVSELAPSNILNVVQSVNSVAAAEALFGSNYAYGANLMKMIRAAFAEGASTIKAVTIGTPTRAAPTNGSQGTLTANALAGDTAVQVASATIYTAGDIVFLGTGQSYDYEERLVVASGTGTTLTFTTPLQFAHYTGEMANIITEHVDADYTTGITALESDPDKSMVACQLNTDTTASAMLTMCDNSTNNYNTPCIYVRAPEGLETASDFIADATATNNNRVVCVWPNLVDFNGKMVTDGETAAAVCGAIAGNGVPKLNHNFTAFSSFGGVSQTTSDMDSLISAGITPIELKYNTIHIVRFVTTWTKLNSVPDTTWQEAAVRLNVDYIEKSLSARIQQKFLQLGNTAQVRLAIQKECVSLLTVYASNNILVADSKTGTPAFKDPVVTQDPVDSTKVNVEIAIAPGKPLNFVSLSFKVLL